MVVPGVVFVCFVLFLLLFTTRRRGSGRGRTKYKNKRKKPYTPTHTTGEDLQEQVGGNGGVGAVGAEDRAERPGRELQEDEGASWAPGSEPQLKR